MDLVLLVCRVSQCPDSMRSAGWENSVHSLGSFSLSDGLLVSRLEDSELEGSRLACVSQPFPSLPYKSVVIPHSPVPVTITPVVLGLGSVRTQTPARTPRLINMLSCAASLSGDAWAV